MASGESMALGHVLILYELVVYPVSNDCATCDSTNHFVFICTSSNHVARTDKEVNRQVTDCCGAPKLSTCFHRQTFRS